MQIAFPLRYGEKWQTSFEANCDKILFTTQEAMLSNKAFVAIRKTTQGTC